jgi:hypothetical protein
MRISYLIIIIAFSFIHCTRISPEGQPDNTSDSRIRKQAVKVAEKYILGQLKDPERTEIKSGLIIFDDGQKKYIINPAMIFTGLIDEDSSKDAIMTLTVFQGSYQIESEQLIILRKNKEFVLVSSIESDMQIISLIDRIITADVPEHSRNNPLFTCESCWEVVKYQFKTGELLRIE